VLYKDVSLSFWATPPLFVANPWNPEVGFPISEITKLVLEDDCMTTETERFTELLGLTTENAVYCGTYKFLFDEEDPFRDRLIHKLIASKARVKMFEVRGLVFRGRPGDQSPTRELWTFRDEILVHYPGFWFVCIGDCRYGTRVRDVELLSEV
jgi:hypothetical protein